MGPKTNGRGRAVIAVFIAITTCFCTKADLITIAIEAVVTDVDDPSGWLDGNIQVNDIIKGHYTYDTAITPIFPTSPTVAQYWHYSSPCGVSVQTSGFTFATDMNQIEFLVEIVNNYEGQAIDYYYWSSYKNSPLPNGTIVKGIGFGLEDYTGIALDSLDLPITQPNLPDWEYDYLDITGGVKTQTTYEFRIRNHVTQVELVPEPATLFLFGLGGLFLRRRSGRISKKNRRT